MARKPQTGGAVTGGEQIITTITEPPPISSGRTYLPSAPSTAVEFEMAPLRHAAHILPDTMIAARQAADPGDTTAFAPLEPRLKLLTDDLTWWAGDHVLERILENWAAMAVADSLGGYSREGLASLFGRPGHSSTSRLRGRLMRPAVCRR